MKKKKIKRWTEEEVAFIARTFREYSNEEIAEELGVSPEQVKTKAYNMGLRKGRNLQDEKGGKLKCLSCKEYLDKDMFYKHSKRPTGRQTICISCKKEKNTKKLLKEQKDRKRIELYNTSMSLEEIKEMLSKSTKTCSECGEEKSEDNFRFVGFSKDGKTYSTRSYCNKCKAEKEEDYRSKRIQKGLDW